MKHTRFRMWRSATAMLLVFTMLFGLCGTAFATEPAESGSSLVLDVTGPGGNPDGKITYMSMGESMTNGYGMDGYYNTHPNYANVQYPTLEPYLNSYHLNSYQYVYGGAANPDTDDTGYYDAAQAKTQQWGNKFGWGQTDVDTYPADFTKYLQGMYGAENVVWEPWAMSGQRPEDFYWLMQDAWQIQYEAGNYMDAYNDQGKPLYDEETGIYYGDMYTTEIWKNGNNSEATISRFLYSKYCRDNLFLYWSGGSLQADILRQNVSWTNQAGNALYKSTAAAEAELALFREEYRQAIANADIISINLGTHSFSSVVSSRMLNVLAGDADKFADGRSTLAHIVECYPEYKNTADEVVALFKNTMGSKMKEMGIPEDKLEQILQVYGYATLSFMVTYDKTIEIIHKINPNAKIMVFGMSNIQEGLKFTMPDGSTLDMGDLHGLLVDFTNLYRATKVEETKNAIFVPAVKEMDLLIDGLGRGEVNKTYMAKMVDTLLSWWEIELYRNDLVKFHGIKGDCDCEDGTWGNGTTPDANCKYMTQGLWDHIGEFAPLFVEYLQLDTNEEREALLATKNWTDYCSCGIGDPYQNTNETTYYWDTEPHHNGGWKRPEMLAKFSGTEYWNGYEYVKFEDIEWKDSIRVVGAIFDDLKEIAAMDTFDGEGFLGLMSADMNFKDTKYNLVTFQEITESEKAIIHLWLRCFAAEGIGCHPSELGHDQVSAKMIECWEAEYSGEQYADALAREKVEQLYYYLKDDKTLNTEEKVDLMMKLYDVMEGKGTLGQYPQAAVAMEIYDYLDESNYITDEQTLAIILEVYGAALKGSVNKTEIAAFVYETLLGGEDVTDAQKKDTILKIYDVLRSHDMLKDYIDDETRTLFEDLCVALDPYVTDEQAMDIADLVYGQYKTGEIDKIEIAKSVFELLIVNNEYNLDPAGKVAIIGEVYAALNAKGYLKGYAKELGVIEEIYTFLNDNEYISDKQAVDIVIAAYEVVLGNVDVKTAAVYIYRVLSGVNPSPMMFRMMRSTIPVLEAGDKLAIIEKVYQVLEDNDYLTEYTTELDAVVEIYDTMKSTGDISDEKLVEVFEIVFFGVMEDEAAVEEIGTEIYNAVMNDTSISAESKTAIVEKVVEVLKETGIAGSGAGASVIPQLDVLVELLNRLKAAGLMTDEAAVALIQEAYKILMSGTEPKISDAAEIVNLVYSEILEELTNEQRLQALQIVYTTLDEYGYVDQAIDLADVYYQAAMVEILTAENVEMALYYIDQTIAAMETAKAAVAGTVVPADLADVQAALVEELAATVATLKEVRTLVANGAQNDLRGIMAAMMSLRDDLDVHAQKITALALELGDAAVLYTNKAIAAAEQFAGQVDAFVQNAYAWVVAMDATVSSEYEKFVKSITAEIRKYSDELAAVVEEYLLKTPAEVMAIVYTAGEEAVNEFIGAAIAAADEIKPIIIGISQILKDSAIDLYEVLEAPAVQAVQDEIAKAKDKIMGLKEAIENKELDSFQKAEYMDLLEQAKTDLALLQGRLVDTITDLLTNTVDPAVGTMINQAVNAMMEIAKKAETAGWAYGEWFAERFEQMYGDLLTVIIENTNYYGTLAEAIVTEMIEQFIEDAEKKLEDAYEQIKEKIENLEIEIADIDLNSVYAAIAQLEGIASDIRSQLATLKKYTSDNVDAEIAVLEAALAQVDYYTAKLRQLTSDIENLVNKIEDEPEMTCEKVQNIVAQAQSIAADVVALAEEAKAALVLVGEAYEQVMPALIGLMEYVEEGSPADQFVDTANMTIGEFVGVIKTNYAATEAAINTAIVNVDRIANETVAAVSQTVADAIELMVSATDTAVKNITDIVIPTLTGIRAEAEKLAKSTDAKIAAAGKQICSLIDTFELSYSEAALVAKHDEVVAITSGVINALQNVKSAEEAKAVYAQAGAVLNELSKLAEEVYGIAKNDAESIVNNAIAIAEQVKAIAETTGGQIYGEAETAYNAAVTNITVAAGQVVTEVETLVTVYGETVATAAETIINVVGAAAENIGKEVEMVAGTVDAAINNITAAVEGLKAIEEAAKDVPYDTTNGEYTVDQDSYYVALGNADYAEALAEMLGLSDAYVKLALNENYMAEVAKADLVTVKFDNGEVLQFVTDQVMGLVADFINNNAVIQNEFSNPWYGEAIKEMIVSKIDLTKSYDAGKVDWSKYDAAVIDAKDEMLTVIKNILVEQGVPAELKLDSMIEDMMHQEGGTTIDIPDIYVPVLDYVLVAIENVVYSYVSFAAEFPVVLNEIRAAAPEAQVVVTGISNNLYAVLPAEIAGLVDLSAYTEYMDYVVDALNAHLFTYAAINTNTTYVEDPTAENIYEALHVTHVKADYLLGDVELDGDVDLDDWIVLRHYLLGNINLTDIQKEVADVDFDGDADVDDWIIIRHHLLKNINLHA